MHRLSALSGVVAVILFGSAARGDADEYSDLDLLILFMNRASLWGSWDSVFQITGSIKNCNIHAIPQVLDELDKANPTFLKELEKNRKVLYARWPFLLSSSLHSRPFSIIAYDLSALSYRDKMRVIYRLYGKGGSQAPRSGAIKIAPGCLLVPREKANEILALLRSHGAKVSRKVEIFLEESKKE